MLRLQLFSVLGFHGLQLQAHGLHLCLHLGRPPGLLLLCRRSLRLRHLQVQVKSLLLETLLLDKMLLGM